MAAKKILVAHPGKQHVFQLLAALKKTGSLFKFITTVYDKDDSLTNKAKKFLKGKNLKKAASRKSTILNDNEIILYNEGGGLLLILLGKIGINKTLNNYFYRIIHRSFANKVAKYAIKNNVDAVVLFDSNVYDCFKKIKQEKPQIVCILDVTIASRLYMKEIYINDMAVTNDKELYKEQIHLWNEANIENYKNEFINSDYLLVGSEFVKKSIIPIIGSADKIVKIPYGVDVSQFNVTKKDYSTGPLKLFFVGGVNRRKGIHHLLGVVSQYTKEQVVLSLAGGYDANSDLYLNYKDSENITFEGFVTRDVVADKYASSHIFVLPSLSEGLALVGLEALASGLPVLCTENTGVNDLITNGENGFVVPASDPAAFKAKIDWFIANRDKIESMSLAARNSVEGYSWDKYHERIVDFFNNI